MTYNFSNVLVVVDQRRVRAISRGQFADYIAMVSLAKITPGARLGDAATILSLFDDAQQSVPTGLSDWDQAFLKSLYTTDQKSRVQRSLISKTIMREVSRP
ncbi:MAG: hypothetical protein WDM77_08990 [Steroidobacteraceae bacterium]